MYENPFIRRFLKRALKLIFLFSQYKRKHDPENLKNYVSSRNIPAGVYSLSKHWLVFSRRSFASEPHYTLCSSHPFSLKSKFFVKKNSGKGPAKLPARYPTFHVFFVRLRCTKTLEELQSTMQKLGIVSGTKSVVRL